MDGNYKNDPNAKILHVCHSQGALHTRNALNKLPKELRKHIQVVAIAPAGYILEDLCETATHYVSSKDFIPSFDGEGRGKCKDSTKVLKPLGDTFLDHEFQSLTYEKVLRQNVNYFIRS